MVLGPSRQPEPGAQLLGNNTLGVRLAELPSAPDPTEPPASCLHTPLTQPPQGQEQPPVGAVDAYTLPLPPTSLLGPPLTWALGKVLGASVPQLRGPELQRAACLEGRGAVGLLQLCKGKSQRVGGKPGWAFQPQPHTLSSACHSVKL